jgi:hypothetical protein
LEGEKPAILVVREAKLERQAGIDAFWLEQERYKRVDYFYTISVG